VIGAGRHEVKIVSHVLTKSSQKGTPCMAVVFEDDAGEHITYYGYLSDAALEYTLKALAAMGWDAAQHDGRIDVLNGTDLLLGHKVEIVVDEEEYEGKVRAKVRFVNEIGGGMGERMAPEEGRSFAAQLRAKILAAKGPKPNAAPARKPVTATAPAATATDGVNLDDCPF